MTLYLLTFYITIQNYPLDYWTSSSHSVLLVG